jgi:hypothetical protein
MNWRVARKKERKQHFQLISLSWRRAEEIVTTHHQLKKEKLAGPESLLFSYKANWRI